LCAAAFVACGGSSSSASGGDAGSNESGDSGGGGGGDSGGSPDDSGGGSSDSSVVVDSSIPPDPTDGPPTRQTCVAPNGTALTMVHGRLDGYLVAIVPTNGSHTCNADSTHVHLQVKMNNEIYDVAANIDTMVAERDLPLPDGAWAEGWHTSDSLDYVQLGLHSADFASVGGNAPMATKIEQELANANHISVFCTGYGPNGCHLVHRQGGGRDGAIIIHPTSATSHALFFDFTTSQPF
jgi:hypothetical protein